MEDCPQGLKDCRNPPLGLEEILKQRSRELQGKEESQVIMSFSLMVKYGETRLNHCDHSELKLCLNLLFILC